MDANNSNGDVTPFEVSLPDGSIVDINTKEGANAFLEGDSAFNFISSNLKEIRKLRKKKRLNAGDEEKLERHYELIFQLSRNADRKTFCEKIPQSEIQDSLDYIIDEIKSFTVKEEWIRTGRLDTNDYRVLQFCDNMLHHVAPVYLAFIKSDFFQVLANFIKARKEHGGRGLPDGTICVSICRIALCTLITANCHFDNQWSIEEIFKNFEASGILEQIVRCATVPGPVGLGSENCLEWEDPVDGVLYSLQCCPSILKRKFKSGEPCGDTLKAILDGRDGSRSMQPRILNRLKGIATLVETMDQAELNAKEERLSACNFCSKHRSVTRLNVCSGCRFASYCSKGCQKAHWKIHKKSCGEIKPELYARAMLTMFAATFMNQNRETVLHALQEKCGRTGLELVDLAVEVDFVPNEYGIIPAFHDPPVFRIVLIQDYLSGQDMPEWLRGDKTTDRRRAWFKDFKHDTRERRSSFAMVMHYAGRDIVLPDFSKFSD